MYMAILFPVGEQLKILSVADSCHDFRGDSRPGENIDNYLDTAIQKKQFPGVNNGTDFLSKYFETEAKASFEPTIGEKLEEKLPDIFKPIQATYRIKDNNIDYTNDLNSYLNYDSIRIFFDDSPSVSSDLNYLGKFIRKFM